MMTGIMRVSKESVFSDLNNLNVVTTTSAEYESSFGFTEEEVFHALETMGMSEEKQLDQDENAIWSLMLARGFKKEEIRHYGFAFEGKKILIGTRE